MDLEELGISAGNWVDSATYIPSIPLSLSTSHVTYVPKDVTQNMPFEHKLFKNIK